MQIQFKNLITRLGIFFIVVAMMAGCGNAQKDDENKTDEDQTTTQLEGEVHQEVTAPAVSDVSFTDQEGKSVSLSSLKGKVVFINFWATWCPPCIEELPSINKLRSSFKDNDNIVFLMVDVDSKMEESSAFMQENSYDLPVYIPTGDIPPDYLGNAIPTTVILDKKGAIAARMEGGRDYADPQILTSLKELVESE